ncbi:MAG: hypothetical protein D6710_01805 [Nitrospirae bacterium]|nr:MAG: hypothetical protein D6710_01805 [Nitrospirota bacterium]
MSNKFLNDIEIVSGDVVLNAVSLSQTSIGKLEILSTGHASSGAFVEIVARDYASTLLGSVRFDTTQLIIDSAAGLISFSDKIKVFDVAEFTSTVDAKSDVHVSGNLTVDGTYPGVTPTQFSGHTNDTAIHVPSIVGSNYYLYDGGGTTPTWIASQGTSFPGSPFEGQIFYRTDLDEEFYYDSTRSAWLSTNEIQIFAGVPDGIPSWKPRIGVLTTDDTTQNWNPASETAITWNQTGDTWNSLYYNHSTTTNPSRFIAKAAGTYKIEVWAHLSGSVQRSSTILRLKKNGTTYIGEMAGGYIRALSNNNESFVAISTYATLDATDYIEVTAQAEATAGTVNVPISGAWFSMEFKGNENAGLPKNQFLWMPGGMQMSSTYGYPAPFSGRITSMLVTKDDNSSISRFNLMVGGSNVQDVYVQSGDYYAISGDLNIAVNPGDMISVRTLTYDLVGSAEVVVTMRRTAT